MEGRGFERTPKIKTGELLQDKKVDSPEQSQQDIELLTNIFRKLRKDERGMEIVFLSEEDKFQKVISKAVASKKITPDSADAFRMLRILYQKRGQLQSKIQQELQSNITESLAVMSGEKTATQSQEKTNHFRMIQEGGATFYVLKDEKIVDRADAEKKDPYEAWLDAAQNNFPNQKVRYPTQEEAEKLLRSMQNTDIPQTLGCFIKEKNKYCYLSPTGEIIIKEGNLPAWAITQVLAVVPE